MNFPSKCWLSFKTVLTRISKNCQYFHAHLNKKFYKSDPNTFIFLDILIKLTQTDIYIKINIGINNILKITNTKIITAKNN